MAEAEREAGQNVSRNGMSFKGFVTLSVEQFHEPDAIHRHFKFPG
jgi:hypothetical protein